MTTFRRAKTQNRPPPLKIGKNNKLKARRWKKSTMRKSLFRDEEQVYA
jgi:hypothetical protein